MIACLNLVDSSKGQFEWLKPINQTGLSVKSARQEAHSPMYKQDWWLLEDRMNPILVKTSAFGQPRCMSDLELMLSFYIKGKTLLWKILLPSLGNRVRKSLLYHFGEEAPLWKPFFKKHNASTRSGLPYGQSQTLVAGVGEAEEDLRILHVVGEIRRWKKGREECHSGRGDLAVRPELITSESQRTGSSRIFDVGCLMLEVAGVETWEGANVGNGEARQQDARLARPRGRFTKDFC